jgi:hypothetical protein
MSCVGDGKCMKLCKNPNVCFINHEISSDYTRFCKIKCEHKCKLIPCKNNLHCKSESPAYFFKEKNEIYGGCIECSVFNITFLNEKRICLVCSTPQYMIVTKCGHEMCFECLFDINDDIAQCPFCRTEIELK